MLVSSNFLFHDKSLLVSFLMMLISYTCFSQSIFGPNPTEPNTTQTYEYSDGLIHNNRQWLVSGGSIVSDSYTKFPMTYKVTISWGSGSSGTVTFKSNGATMASLTVNLVPGSGGGSNPSNMNYIRSFTPKFATSDITGLDEDEIIESITYFDGIGRPIQNIGVGQGGNGEDLLTHMEYDGFGRNSIEYLPYPETDNSVVFKDNITTSILNYYSETSYPYSEKSYDQTPLNRIVKQSAPGDDWRMGAGNEIEFEYDTNITDEVQRYYVSFDQQNKPILELAGHYGPNELFKIISKDENHSGTSTAHTNEEFKDAQGRVILKRTYGDSKVDGVLLPNTQHDTYYVYDIYGNLTYVLSPKAEPHSAKPDPNELSELCYQYIYDSRNRLVEKKIPGKEWEYIVYNNLDNPIMTQDGELRNNNQWLFTKYDAFGRIVYSGVKNTTGSRLTFQGYANTANYEYEIKNSTNGGSYSTYYTSRAIPTNVNSVDIMNYYDDYTFDLNSLSLPSTCEGEAIVNYNNSTGTQKMTKGLPTGTKVRTLGTGNFTTTLIGYDGKAQAIYSKSKNNFLGTTDSKCTKLDFQGLPLRTTLSHLKSGNSSVTLEDDYEYDHANRLLSQKQSINGSNDEVIFENDYDDLGRLISKDLGGNISENRLQNIDYTYNIRGWLKSINDRYVIGNDLFFHEIFYNDPNTGIPLYNGNISKVIWKTMNSDQSTKSYDYFYDDMNRIVSALDNTGNYKVDDIYYDKNGNITDLSRWGRKADGTYTKIDELRYAYHINGPGNLLNNVNDMTGITDGFNNGYNNPIEYNYDDNGNMVRDYNKGISSDISYNYLNLPTNIVLSGGSISYDYDAMGNKLKKNVSTGTNTEYAGGFVYENNNLSFFGHPEGYVEHNGSGGFDYVYQYKDHLGNNRLSFKDNIDYNIFVNDRFINDVGNWYYSGSTGSGQTEIEGKKLRVNVRDNYNGAEVVIGTNFSIGDKVTIRLDLDKGNTDKIRILMIESNYSNWYSYGLNGNAATGSYSFEYTITNYAPHLKLKIDKSNTNSGIPTYFFIDNVVVTKGEPTIVKENNYYPFGLKHEGYNDGGTSFYNPALDFQFNGIEYEEELGLNLYEMDVRLYDPSIGRFNGIDPVIHFSQGTSVGFDNNPIYWADPSGADSEERIGADGLTNSQWIESSGIKGWSFEDIRAIGRLNNSNKKKSKTASVSAGELVEGEGESGKSNCISCDLRFKIALYDVKIQNALIQGDGDKVKQLNKIRGMYIAMLSDHKVKDLVAPTDPFGLLLHFGTLGIGSKLGIGLSSIKTWGKYGWKGIQIGSKQYGIGYRIKTGIGFSYRITKNGIVLGKDFHTLGGKFRYHWHYYEAGKFTSGHLSPSIMKKYGYKFKDLFQGLPDFKWKKSPLWEALEAARY